MLKIIIPLLSSLNLLFSQTFASQETSKAHYQKAIQISKSQMAQLLKNNPKIESQRLALATFEDLKEKEERKKREKEKEEEEKKEKLKKRREEQRRSNQNPQENTQGSHNIVPNQINLGGSNGKAALVVFAIIGLVVVIAWIPYAVMGIRKLVSNPSSSDLSFLFTTNVSLIENKKIRLQTQSKRGGSDFNFNLSFFFNGVESTQFGLSTEMGYHFLKDQLTSGSIDHNAIYALTGPSLRFFLDEKKSKAFKLDLMAGTSDDNTIGLLSKAQILLQTYQDNMVFHVGGGSQFIESVRTEGPLLNLNSFNLYATVGFGFVF